MTCWGETKLLTHFYQIIPNASGLARFHIELPSQFAYIAHAPGLHDYTFDLYPTCLSNWEGRVRDIVSSRSLQHSARIGPPEAQTGPIQRDLQDLDRTILRQPLRNPTYGSRGELRDQLKIILV